MIENTQRDVNIALINELALIFNRLGIDTEEVLDAGGSKWNFLPFRPGLVGGHCIGVDPYYLTHKAQEIGYHAEMILAGRRLNDNMALYVTGQITRLMASQAHPREWRARTGAGHDLQGKLPGYPQLQGRRRGARAAEPRRQGRHLRPLGGRGRVPSRVRVAHRARAQAGAATTWRSWRSRTGSFASSARAACGACARRTTCSTTSSTCSRRPPSTDAYEAAPDRCGRLHRLAHRPQAARARPRSRGPGQSQRVLRRDAQAGAAGAPDGAARLSLREARSGR